ncbi:zinc-dependent peptidase [Chryseolinea sp. H1M3-3]|uniref:zinc-dependent peptidase n=1 Tax=Chryseolinea sp. H1M3-3 TaxID=3034144 RepID=UPI0023EC506F|nr:zinc-dependent peptidase [Chryseolinea sp. H1M3-3]
MVAFILIIAFIISFSIFYSRQRKHKKGSGVFPGSWKKILDQKVVFYHNLSPEEKNRFEQDVGRFFNNVRITGINTDIDITDKLLVASSAIIPVFGFPEWDYTFLDEVLLYPDSFDSKYTINSKEETITGMVGSGTMEGKMILSKPSLHRGFDNSTDKQNVGIHEFIHLLDKEDGNIDGVPSFLNGKIYALPWLNLIQEKTAEIIKGKSDINEYGATHQREFLPVIGEYFFERPQLLQKNHPELYELLSKAFKQDTASTLKITNRRKSDIERNDPCPCGSGKKFKKCCINN